MARGRAVRTAASAMFSLVALAGTAAASTEVMPLEQDLNLTIYRQDVALVQDRRELPQAGRGQRLAWGGVAPTLRHDTVRLSGLGGALRGYRLRHERISMLALVEAYVGRTIGIEHRGARGRAVTEATLVSAAPLLASVDGEVRSVEPSVLVFPEGIPSDMGADPALELELAPGHDASARHATLAYLARGFSWTADYVATITADGRRLNLEARATLENASGLDLAEARVELVAGRPKVPEPTPGPQPARLASEAAYQDRTTAAPERMGDLHRYTLDAPVTLADGERYSRRLFARRDTPVKRSHVLRSALQVLGPDAAAGWRTAPMVTELTWTTGGPLPAGIVRVYRADEDGLARFVGGDRVSDVPAGRPVTIEPGRPFHITARRRQTGYERLGERSYAVAHAIELHNAGSTPAPIRVEERIPGDWRIVRASESWEREAAQLAVWRLTLAPGKTRTLTYRARIER